MPATVFDGEIWRTVPSVPALMVSSEGRMMVAPYEAKMPKGGVRQYGGEAHFGVWDKAAARFITVYKGRTYKIAQLICEAFHGPKPFEGAVVMHVDENAANNRARNLKWGTQKENLNALGFLEYCRGRTGENSTHAKSKRRVA
jgi:hypothetical protein